jgi:hypothetical protein
MAQPPTGRREFARYDTDVSAHLTSRSMRIAVRMLSVSAGGALVRMDRLSAKVFDDDEFVLEISGVGRFSANKKWRRDTDIGAGFVLSDPDRLRLAERLADRFGPRRPQYQRLAVNSPQP